VSPWLSNERIAQRLDITAETVKSHACAQAVARAEALGMI
jgi:ATP/maltotriose-dependent transcriptional regulator MalT